MDLTATILFIEARETGKRSAGVLSGNTIASNIVNKATVATEGVSQSHSEIDKSLSCKNCGRTGAWESTNCGCTEAELPSMGSRMLSLQEEGAF